MAVKRFVRVELMKARVWFLCFMNLPFGVRVRDSLS